MDTSTGRFISMDTYQGSTADPISLHKYLYANSNPVMYTDPSGYMSLADTMTACAVLGTLSGGMINAGYNVLRFLIGDPEMTSKYDSPVTAYINGFLDGMIWGLFVGISIGTFLTLGVYIGLIVSINFGCSYWHYLEGKSAAESGKWDWAIINLFYSVFYMYAGFTTVGMAMDTHTMLPENMPDENANSTSNSNNNSLPIDNDSQMNHIFRDAYGHIPDTPQNRQLLLSCGTNDAYYNGTDSYGNDWYIRPISETEYVWVESRNGVIWDGGISDRKLNWSDETGYKPPKKH